MEYDVVIVGAGAAGLSLALNIADHASVLIICKAELSESATLYAQGGISAVLDESDSIDAHVRDTMVAGAGLCREDAVRFIVSRGRERIQWLIEQGVPFTRESGANGQPAYHLHKEGGHSHRRIIHAADATGRAVEETLVERVRAHPDIHILEYHMAVDLVTTAKLGMNRDRCAGIYVLDSRSGQVSPIATRTCVLASGGAGKAYLYTSNPDGSTGDGIAMALRAGCPIANMEFIQFHPTCLFHPAAKSFLVTEALRGEGARLLLPNGEPFMDRFDERKELAPRDVVARAIDHEMKRLGVDHVLLDISHRSADFIEAHFPTVLENTSRFGFDMRTEPLPVVPAAHYTCGGVLTDTFGHTSLHGLYAIGEVACTGLHGANRMASNSLLECVVLAESCAEAILNYLEAEPPFVEVPPWDESRVTDADENVVISHNWDELRRFMWDYVGIVRTSKRLERAQHRLALLRREVADYYGNFKVNPDLIELRNLIQVSEVIVHCARKRKESRGLHYIRDYPETNPAMARDTVVRAGDLI